MSLRTALTEMVGITVPVIAAPMAGVADVELAAAVSRAGALGTIGVSSARSADWVHDQLNRARIADVPFGVGLMAWSLPENEEVFDLVIKACPALVSISLGDLDPWVGRARGAGVAVAVQVGTVAEAHTAQRVGASLIVARGAEAGGHGRADVATLPLLQEILDTVSVPVVAAGGIAGPRGLAAAVAAGAAGVWAGTAFAGCLEATSSPEARHAMAQAKATDTVYTRAFDIAQRIPWPADYGGRALRNEFSDRWADAEEELSREVAGESADSGVTAAIRLARAEADVATAPVYCGQGVAQIQVDRSAAEIVHHFAQAEDLLRAVPNMLR